MSMTVPVDEHFLNVGVFWKKIKCQRLFTFVDEFNSFGGWIDVDDWKNGTENFLLHYSILGGQIRQKGQFNEPWLFMEFPTWKLMSLLFIKSISIRGLQFWEIWVQKFPLVTIIFFSLNDGTSFIIDQFWNFCCFCLQASSKKVQDFQKWLMIKLVPSFKLRTRHLWH